MDTDAGQVTNNPGLFWDWEVFWIIGPSSEKPGTTLIKLEWLDTLETGKFVMEILFYCFEYHQMKQDKNSSVDSTHHKASM
jgi:hypothetical protein